MSFGFQIAKNRRGGVGDFVGALVCTFVVLFTACDQGGAPDNGGSDLESPIAEFTVDPFEPVAGSQVTFDASSSTSPNGEITAYRWNFLGDGGIDTTTQGPTVAHIYEEGGARDVTLEVMDEQNETASSSKEIAVQEPPKLADTAWPTLGHDLRRTGQSPFNGAEDGTEKWTFDTNQRMWGGAVIGPDGTVYVGTEGYVFAVNQDGTERWRFGTDSEAETFDTPAIGSGGTIYVGSDINQGGGRLYALNPDGTEKWRFDPETDASISSSPAIGKDGTIYFGANDNRLYAVGPDGSKKWEFRAGDVITEAPAVGNDGTIYVGSFDGYLYAVRPDGTLEWDFRTNGVPRTPAIGPEGTLYIAVSLVTNFFAVNPDGTEKWRFRTGSGSQPAAVGSNGTIFVSSWNRDSNEFFLHARNPDGSEKWTVEDSVLFSTPAIGAEGTVYTIGQDQSEDRVQLHAFDSENGNLNWQGLELGGWASPSAAIGSDGTMYIASRDGILYAVE
jgi:outer membrane protein assembly factor BamB